MKFEKLENLAKIQIGKTPKRAEPEYWGKGFPWVSISDLQSEVIENTKEEITEKAIKECGCKLIPKGTLIMSFKLSVGKLAFAGKDLYTNEAICGFFIKESETLDSKYFYYALKNTRFTGSNTAVMGNTLNTDSLNNLKIPYTSDLQEQKHIAAVLSKAEALIAERKQSIQLLDEYLKSTFLEMFGDPEKNPKNFPFTELQKLCSVIVDCPHSTPVKANEVTNYPCIRTSELTNGYITWDSMQYLDEDEYIKRTQRLIPEAGDIVYGREGTYGEAIRIPNTHKFSLGQRTMLFRPDYKKTDSIFLWAMVRSEFVYKQAKKKNSGSTVGHVNVKDIKQFKVYNPPLKLQTQFAQIVEKTEALKAQYKAHLQELEQLYGALSQRAFRGDLCRENLSERV